METNEKDLKEMQAQLHLLKAKLDEQQLANEQHIRLAMTRSASYLKNLNAKVGWIGLPAAFLCALIFYAMGMSLAFCLCTLALVLADSLYHIFAARAAKRLSANESMADWAKALLRFKSNSRLDFIVGVAVIVPWFAWLGVEYSSSEKMGLPAGWHLVPILLGGVVGSLIAYCLFRSEHKVIDSTLQQIEDIVKQTQTI